MKTSWVLLLSGTALAAYQHHPRLHRHHPKAIEKRDDEGHKEPGVVYAPGPTVVVYVLDGKPISQEDVNQGIANGTLVLDDTDAPSGSITISPSPALNSAAATSSSSVVQVTSVVESAASQSSAPAAPEPESPKSADQKSKGPTEEGSDNHTTEDLTREFSTGLPCNKFPEGYGAVPIEHLGLGGWIGIQKPEIISAAGFGEIVTTPTHSCDDGSCCVAGAFCSYSCPVGYLKTAWPKKQGIPQLSSAGEVQGAATVGGLYCNNDGVLEMPDGSIAKTLCMPGTDKVTIRVQNNLTDSVSICQTDYPGTESETVPSTVAAGRTVDLACPDQTMYYRHLGKKTSAQYYINNRGVAEKDACWWSDGSKPVGNWAPMNLGVSYDSEVSRAHISLFQNRPTTDKKLDFAVEFLLEGPNRMKCKYANGKWCGGDNYEKCNDNDCDVAFDSGTLTILFTDN